MKNHDEGYVSWNFSMENSNWRIHFTLIYQLLFAHAHSPSSFIFFSILPSFFPLFFDQNFSSFSFLLPFLSLSINFFFLISSHDRLSIARHTKIYQSLFTRSFINSFSHAHLPIPRDTDNANICPPC